MKQLGSNLRRRSRQINCGKPYTMVLNGDRLVNHFSDGRVEKQSTGAVSMGIAAPDLGSKISVDLVDVSATQRFVSIPPTCYNRCEFGIDDNSLPQFGIVEHYISSHHRQNSVDTSGPFFDLPS